MKYKICVALLLAMAFSVQADSRTMRCGTKIVSVGDRVFEVERKCGAPDLRYLVGYTGDAMYVPIEEWIYNHTTGSATAYNLLRFEGGRLVNIETRFPIY